MCGIVGVVGYRPITSEGINAARASNRRGPAAFGICGFNTVEGHLDDPIKDVGSVLYVAQKHDLYATEYRTLIGQTRYPTSGSTRLEDRVRDAQPLKHRSVEIAVAHNGQVHNLIDLRESRNSEDYQSECDVEEILLELGDAFQARDYLKKRSDLDFFREVVLPSVNQVYERIHGAYSVVVQTHRGLFAFKDPNGIKPLCYGLREEGPDQKIHMFASESVSFHFLGGFRGIRELYGGQVTFITHEGRVFNRRIRNVLQTPDGFEPVYTMDAASEWCGESVYSIRERGGHVMAETWPELAFQIDRVVGVPMGAVPIAKALAFDMGLMEGGVVLLRDGKTFYGANPDTRKIAVDQKYMLIKPMHSGKRVLWVDDSLVRGTTIEGLVRMSKALGSAENHLRTLWPLWLYGCCNATDVVGGDELAAIRSKGDKNAIAKAHGLDSFDALSVQDLVHKVLRRDISQVCVGCATGSYPNDKGTARQYFQTRLDSRRKGIVS